MRCLLCRRPSIGDLCNKHSLIYIYDKKNKWFRKRKRLDRGVRKHTYAKRIYRTESKLHEILKLIFGRTNVIAGVHPVWAVTNKGALLEYDFGVTDHNLLIEYNGIQHYEYPNFFHRSKHDFMLQKGRDFLKSKMAEDNGWNLMIIKYDENVNYGNVYEKLKSGGLF